MEICLGKAGVKKVHSLSRVLCSRGYKEQPMVQSLLPATSPLQCLEIRGHELSGL